MAGDAGQANRRYLPQIAAGGKQSARRGSMTFSLPEYPIRRSCWQAATLDAKTRSRLDNPGDAFRGIFIDEVNEEQVAR